MRDLNRARRRSRAADRKPLPLPEEAGFGTLLEMLRYAFPACAVSARLFDAGKGLRVWIARPPVAGCVLLFNARRYHDERLELGDVIGWITEVNWRAPLLNHGTPMQPAFNAALELPEFAP